MWENFGKKFSLALHTYHVCPDLAYCCFCGQIHVLHWSTSFRCDKNLLKTVEWRKCPEFSSPCGQIYVGGCSLWLHVACELDVNELQPRVQRCAWAKEHHLSAEEFGHGALWLGNWSCTPVRQPWTPAHQQKCPAWGWPKLYLGLEIRVLAEIRDFSTLWVQEENLWEISQVTLLMSLVDKRSIFICLPPPPHRN